MQKKILVVTATPGFGELIQQTLEETGFYRVALLTSAAEAIGLVQESVYALAILDSDVEDFPYGEFIQALDKVAPAMPLVLIPPDHAQHDPQFARPAVVGYLSKPFYLPDLLELVEKALGPMPKPLPAPAPAPALHQVVRRTSEVQPPVWLDDVSRAAQHLTGLLLGTAAQAALIVRDGKLWAYAGQLAQPAAQELAALVANYGEQERDLQPRSAHRATRSDLARFIRLGSTGGEYMLYATSLVEEMTLALAFDAETPFSKIRSQTSQLARALASAPANTQPVTRNERVTAAAVEQRLPPTRPADPAPRGPIRAIPELSEDWIKIENLAKELSHGEDDEATRELESANALERPMTEAKKIIEALPTEQTQVAETAAPLIVLEPAIPGIINLVYACVIIPRLPQHQLRGDLVGKLMEWMGQLCLAFGWRLENITISPGYLQWIVNVPPTTSPSYLMRIMRQHTSKRIFAEFPALAVENPSGDFWAPGYLIMSSPTPPPESVIQDFIQQLRHHQGASNPFMPQFER